MKKFLITIISFLLGQVSFSQSDSVYLSINPKLITEIQIVTAKGEYGVRENYTYFKYRYWLRNIDTIPISKVRNIESDKSKKKKIKYKQHGSCDSIINQIRNSSYYWKTQSEIDKVARQEIGNQNGEFNSLKEIKSKQVKDFSEKCNNEFKADVSKLKHQLLSNIKKIKKEKVYRSSQVISTPESIDSVFIDSFLETFDLCETDLKTLEIIILNNPNDFITSIDKLRDSDFFKFTLKLDSFNEGINISGMKQTLKELDKKSKRKKKVIRKIKKRKANNQ